MSDVPKVVSRAGDDEDFWYCFARVMLGADRDLAITRALGLLGRAHRADRAWLIRYNEAFTHFWNTHEWTGDGVSEHVGDLQGVPVDFAAWLHESLKVGRPVYIADPRKIPRRARAFQVELRRQGISTLLAVPVFHRGRLMMQIGFDTIGRKESWERWEIDRLRKAGRLIFSRWMMDSAGVLEDFDQGDWASRKVQIENAARHENLSVQEITRISALGDYSRVVFANGREVADSRSLKHWESELLGQDYLRISRSLIVRISLIESLDRRGGAWKLKLENFPDWFPVGRPYRAALRHHLDF